MFWKILNFLFLYTTSWEVAEASTGGFDFMSLMPMLLVGGIFYFLLIRPQQQKVKEHQERLNSLKKGDEVVFCGGMIGIVDKVDGDELKIGLSSTQSVRCVKSAVSQIRAQGKSFAEAPTTAPKAKTPAAKTKAAKPAKKTTKTTAPKKES